MALSVSVVSRLLVAIDAIRREAAEQEDHDLFTLAKAEALLIGYTARWGEMDLETVGVEEQFQIPIWLGGEVRDWQNKIVGRTQERESFGLEGSIDAIVKRFTRGTWQFFNVEHKTTSWDISPGSDYWAKLIALDPQVSTYDAASRAMGYDVRGTIYDVIRKPEMVPLKATPEESKKYTKPTKAEPIPRLYANQRETDETVEEYRERMIADIIARPNWYFARNTIVRLDHDNGEHARDVQETARMIQFATDRDAWPRSPNACERFRRLCEFHPICAGETSADDMVRYARKSEAHEELTYREGRRLPVLTQSSLTTFRRCPREYRLKYRDLLKSRHKSEALRFGTLFHRGLNAWWAAGKVKACSRS